MSTDLASTGPSPVSTISSLSQWYLGLHRLRSFFKLCIFSCKSDSSDFPVERFPQPVCRETLPFHPGTFIYIHSTSVSLWSIKCTLSTPTFSPKHILTPLLFFSLIPLLAPPLRKLMRIDILFFLSPFPLQGQLCDQQQST